MNPASDPSGGTLGRREFLATACGSAAALSLPLAPSARGERSPSDHPPLGNRLLAYYPFAEGGEAGLRNHAPGIDGMHATRFGGGEFDASPHPSGPGFRGAEHFRSGDRVGRRPASPTGPSLNLVAARNDALVVPVSAATLGRDFTIALWHWLDPNCTVARPFVFEGADNHHVSWGIGRGDHYAAYVTQAQILAGGDLPRGLWIHCAHVFSSDREKSTLRLFLDGKLVGTAEGSMMSLHFPALHIGKQRSGDTSRQWDGMIAELALWGRALRDDEVARIHQLGRDRKPLSSAPDFTPAFRGQVAVVENGTRKPLPGVLVSDGLHVAATAAEGRFELPGHLRQRFVMATIPAGYQAVDSHYIPANRSTDAFDFDLKPDSRTQPGKPARFVQVADSETDSNHGWIEPIRRFVDQRETGFIMHTGDICYRKAMIFHAREFSRERMGLPVFYGIGNHDMETGLYGEELFERLFGPVFYAFEAGDTHFIVTPMLSGTRRPSYSKTDVARWLENHLKHIAPTKPVVVFNHFALTSGNDFTYESGGHGVRLNDWNLKAWIYGHFHANYMKRHGDTGIHSIQSAPPDMGGINHSPSNFVAYEIDPAGTLAAEPRYNYLDQHLVVVTPAASGAPAATADGRLAVSINTYSAHAATAAAFARIDGDDEWTALAGQSDWNWSGALTTTPDAAAGKTLEVRCVLENGEEFTGRSRIGQSAAGPRIAWTRNVGANLWMGTPASDGVRLFVPAVSQFDLENNRIVAIDAGSGEILWHCKVAAPVLNSVQFESGIVLATDQEGVAYGIDANDGRIRWQRHLGRNATQTYISGGVVHDGVYYTGYGNYLSALDTTTGEVKWRSTAWNAGYGSVGEHTIADDTLVVGANWSNIYAHNRHTGARTWTAGQDGLRSQSSSGLWHDGVLIMTGNGRLVRFDAATGEALSSHALPYSPTVSGRPLIADDLLILGTAKHGVAAFHRETMEEAWRHETGEALVYTAAYSRAPSQTVESGAQLVAGDIVVGASDGHLRALDPATGRPRWSLNLGAPILGTPRVSGASLFVPDFSGNLTRVDLA